MTPAAYLFLFILITNQFFFIHSVVFVHNDQDQNQLENSRYNAIRQLVAKYVTIPDDSSYDDNDLQSFKPTVQRRFCCMSPLSGRKRFVRDLARKRQLSNKLNQ